MIANRSARQLRAIAAGAALTLTACTSSVTGIPRPVPFTGSAAAPAPSADTADGFLGMDACHLLDGLLAGQGFQPGERISPRNACGALKSGYGTDGITLDPVQGLDDFNRTDPSSTTTNINGRKALQALTEFDGSCSVAIEVSTHARAVVDVVLIDTAADACPAARTLAEKLEPLLPKTR